MSVSLLKQFTAELLSLKDFKNEQAIAVGVSGGGDSMALCRLLSEWSDSLDGPDIHILTVDHGLRVEAKEEVKQVESWVKDWPRVSHHGLVWGSDKPESRIQERARAARYDLMASYCKTHNIHYLFLAHHADDQAETVLIRLTKGSGLDGLAAMAPVQVFSKKLSLVRPLLPFTHEQLLAFCKEKGMDWIEDPSNRSDTYLRPRLRKIWSVLEEEGLSTRRLSKIARRMGRARAVLESLTDEAWAGMVLGQSSVRVEFDLKTLKKCSEEIIIRLFLKAFSVLGQTGAYGPRLERVEALVRRFMAEEPFKTATLGGCLFREKRKAGLFIVALEHEENV